ncbi:MAG: hypothetical protein IJ828_12480 [Treponema sp.]|nr:hypothetical protein [Treponema sp.]
MILIDATYSEYTGGKTPEYPGGCAKDASTDEGFDGTEYKARWHNDVIGAMHAVFVAAFGDINRVTNRPDNVLDSDFLRAIKQLTKVQADVARVVKNINGAETILTWSELNVFYSEERHFAAFASFNGKYKEFLPVKAWAEEDGVHVYIRYQDADGNVIDGTPVIKWNTGKWGTYKWGQQTYMSTNIIVKEVFE